jgi:quercetin dioxygenase-like cupin family protein
MALDPNLEEGTQMSTVISRTVITACFAVIATVAHAQSDALKPAQITQEDLTWLANPAGFQVARVVGDPARSGMYVNRVRFPAGLRIQPHFHPDERIVTVLSGTVYFGYGEQFDEANMKALPAGSVWTEPAKQPHFVWAKDAEAVIQVIGNGPSGTTPIKPKQ